MSRPEDSGRAVRVASDLTTRAGPPLPAWPPELTAAVGGAAALLVLAAVRGMGVLVPLGNAAAVVATCVGAVPAARVCVGVSVPVAATADLPMGTFTRVDGPGERDDHWA